MRAAPLVVAILACGACAGDASTGASSTAKLTGTTADLHFDDSNLSTNSGFADTSKTTFSGALAGGVVTGALGFSVAGAGTLGTTSIVQSYTTSMNVTLR